ncbi:MAG: undecaprenyl diphosphate synthase [Alteromonas naphthalenivorans]
MIKHLAMIMDGNRRWAKKNKLSYASGYTEGGFGAAKIAAKYCLDAGIKYLSLYTFSLENFNRPQHELDLLFNCIVDGGKKNLAFFNKENVRVKFIGDRDRFPEIVLPTVKLLEEGTKSNNALQVNFLFCYGARQELVCSIKRLVSKVKKGLLSEDQISEQTLEECLWTSGIPQPELIIRTSGTQRLSNFLLYQAAYSEFCFLDCLWPDITREDIEGAVSDYLGMQKNFGT